jgi:hypothetical protein
MAYDSGVTKADVRGEYDTSASTASVERAIRAAEAVVEQNLDRSQFDDAVLGDIVVYLAAHMVAGTDPTAEKEEVGDSSHSYEGAVGEGLRETRFGRRALSLDHTGGLDAADEDGAVFETFGV